MKHVNRTVAALNRSVVAPVAKQVRKVGRNAVYAPPSRALVKAIMEKPSGENVRKLAESKGVSAQLRRITSEQLPPGHYYARLRIRDWERFNGKRFELKQNGRTVYGNQIEPPARGFPLEYRNIIVTSDNPEDFTFNLPIKWSIKFNPGAFTTPQQVEYDKKYGVEQHGDVFYSLRGNTVNPKRIIFTFPGFGPSTTRISYSVSYLQALTDADLVDTMMVCYQDRYLAAGSYMMVDNGHRSLYSRVLETIEGFRVKHGLSDADLLFFGASKGGSIAINYARDYPKARILVAVPQMNLPYYFNKPFFRDNLYNVKAIAEQVQPETLLRTYFSQGRTIDYFYTVTDELSNHSLIELTYNVKNLTTYRFDGVHGAVAREALPSMLAIMRRFIGAGENQELKVDSIRSFHEGNTVGVQLRLDPKGGLPEGANWYLEGKRGATVFRQVITSHSYPFIKYSKKDQVLFGPLDDIESVRGLTAIEANGVISSGRMPTGVKRPAGTRRINYDSSPLSVDTPKTQSHVVLHGALSNRFSYTCKPKTGGDGSLLVHLTQDVNAATEYGVPHGATPSFIATLCAIVEGPYLPIMLARLAVETRSERVQILVHDTRATRRTITRLLELEWPEFSIELSAPIKGVTTRNAAYASYFESGVIVAAPGPTQTSSSKTPKEPVI